MPSLLKLPSIDEIGNGYSSALFYICIVPEEIATTVLDLLPDLSPPVADVKSKKKWRPSIAEGRKAFVDLQKVWHLRCNVV